MKEKLSVAVYRETNIFYDKTTLTQYFSTTQLYRGHYKVNSNTKKVIIPRKTQENNHHTVKPKEERHTYTHTHTHTRAHTCTHTCTQAKKQQLCIVKFFFFLRTVMTNIFNWYPKDISM